MLYILITLQHLELRRGLTDYDPQTDRPARLFKTETAITVIER